MHNEIVFSFFLIFAGALVLSTVALVTRQPVIIAYIALGAIAGPHGGDISAIRETGVPHGLTCALVAAVLRARQPFAGLSSEANRTLAETGRVLTYSHAGALHGGVTHGRRSWLRSPGGGVRADAEAEGRRGGKGEGRGRGERG